MVISLPQTSVSFSSLLCPEDKFQLSELNCYAMQLLPALGRRSRRKKKRYFPLWSPAHRVRFPDPLAKAKLGSFGVFAARP